MSRLERTAMRSQTNAHGRPRFDHPAIQEMIARRSRGRPDYVVGVRRYLAHETPPANGTVAYGGYLDAHDMSAHLSTIRADLRADERERGPNVPRPLEALRERLAAHRAPAGLPRSPAIKSSNRGVRI